MPQKSKPFQLESSTACVFCGKEENDEFLYGKFFHKKTLSVHQNCLFFASGLSQRGRKETEGILGFLISDIQKEVLRGKKLPCFHCKRKGATVGCCKTVCRRTFHYPCAVQNGTLHQFFGSFSSFCQLHRPVQKPIKTHKEELYCHICFLSLSEKDLGNCLYSTCCNRNLFHRTCLQKYALSAGRHFFKCPLCNNSADFMKEMEFYGICVPEKDASWELEENAYQDLLYRPECGADNCHCADGRKYNGESAWVLLPCCNCGSDARHQHCADLEAGETAWTCNDCKILEDQILKKRSIPDVTSERREGVDPIDSTNQQVPTSEDHAVDSVPSCSIIDSSCILPPLAETESLNIDNVPILSSSVCEDDEPLPCDTVSSAVTSPCKIPLDSKKILESKAKESKSLKREISTQEPNLKNKKMCLMGDILNQIKGEKIQNKHAFMLNSNSLKMNSSTRQSKVTSKKHKIDKKFQSGCCSGNPQRCIKAMFGLQCHNYRV